MVTASFFFAISQQFLLPTTNNNDILSQKWCLPFLKFTCTKAHTGSMMVVKTVFFKVAFKIRSLHNVNIFHFVMYNKKWRDNVTKMLFVISKFYMYQIKVHTESIMAVKHVFFQIAIKVSLLYIIYIFC